MNLELTDEQVALRDTTRRFLAEKAPISGHVRELLDDPTGVDQAVWRGLVDLGTTGLLVPEEYGGAGMTMVEAGIVAEELGAALHPGPWLSSAVAATRALTRLGGGVSGNDRVGTILAGIADGTTIATVGFLDFGSVSVTDTVLRGEIAAVPDAAAADVLLVLAQDAAGTGLFAVNTDASGVSVVPDRSIDRTRKRFRVTLDDAPAHRLGAAAPDAVAAVIDDVLIANAADALGAAQAVMDLAVEYAKVRKQFGQVIGSFQAIQHLCVDMFETVELARSGVIHALWASDAVAGQATEAEARHLAALRAKAFAGRLATVGDTAIQVFGGIGYTWEHDAHLYLKRLLSWSDLLGGPDKYLTEIGAHLAKRGLR